MEHAQIINELLESLEGITLSMAVHPDCTEGSEFADYVSSARKAIAKAKGITGAELEIKK